MVGLHPTDIALDAEQRRAAQFEGGRVKLLGGPGTGKTTSLAERALWLVAQRGVEPDEVIIFVRDRRSGIELKDRLVRRLGRSVAGPSVFTFHAFSWSLLTRGFSVASPDGAAAEVGYQLAGLSAEPVLLTAFDQRAFVRQLLAEEDPGAWPVNRDLLRSNAFAGEVRDFLLRAQERLASPDDVRRLAAERGRPDWDELAGFLERYVRRVQDPAAFEDGRPRLDFAMVLGEARRLIGEHDEVAADLRTVYPHVLVDDFEEANRAEAALLEALLPAPDETGRSALVAGDPHGSVFAFRGADPSGLERLEAAHIALVTPHRGALETSVKLFSHVVEEAKAIVAELRLAGSGGVPWGDMAVIVRDHRVLLAPLRRELKSAGVPHQVDGEAVELSHDPVVRPVLELFSVACGRVGHEELWPSLLTSELGGFSVPELIELRRAARLAGSQLHELCGAPPHEGLAPSVAHKLESVVHLLSNARRWASELAPDECFWRLWQRSSWFAELVASNDERRLDSLTTFADALARFTDRRGRQARMADFIDTLLSAEFAPGSVRLDAAQDAVTIVTAHGTKGRGFEFAVVSGCVEGLWPDPSRRGLLLDVDLLGRPLSSSERQRAALEEEERLFRLALTRARRVVLTGLRAGGSERSSAEPSRFLRSLGGELPEANSSVPDLVLAPGEAEIAWRRIVADATSSAAERLAALWGMAQLAEVDPDRWWWGRAWTHNDTPVVAAPKKTSYSRFSDYENCPLAYLLGQVLGLDPERTYHMAYGSLIHGLLEDAEAGRIDKDKGALVAEAQRRWRAEDYPPGAVANYLWHDCVRILHRYADLEAGNGHKTLRTEQWFEFLVGDWTVRGKIDRIDALDRNGLRLIDYKTSNSWKTNGDVEDDLQLATYYLACKRDENLSGLGDPKCMELLFVRHEKGNAIRRACQLPRKAEDGTAWDDATEGRIASMLDAIDREDFAPSPEADCRFCSFKEICPLWPQGEELQLDRAPEAGVGLETP
ncbi:MAG: ATP-dependent helicase [Actinomycetota bacterium]